MVLPRPTVRVIAPIQGNAGTKVRLSGANFGSSNKVNVCYTVGKVGCASIEALSSDTHTLSFVFPSQVEVYSEEKEGSVFVPAPAGLYSISVSNGVAASDSVFFTLTTRTNV